MLLAPRGIITASLWADIHYLSRGWGGAGLASDGGGQGQKGMGYSDLQFIMMMASMAQTISQHPELHQLQPAMVRGQSDEIQQMEQSNRKG